MSKQGSDSRKKEIAEFLQNNPDNIPIVLHGFPKTSLLAKQFVSMSKKSKISVVIKKIRKLMNLKEKSSIILSVNGSVLKADHTLEDVYSTHKDEFMVLNIFIKEIESFGN